jgi:hypothetical protein
LTCTSCIICHTWNIPHFPVFYDVILYAGDSCLTILVTFFAPTFISITYYLPIPTSLSILPCITVSYLTSSGKS